jgi:hypothetical protein
MIDFKTHWSNFQDSDVYTFIRDVVFSGWVIATTPILLFIVLVVYCVGADMKEQAELFKSGVMVVSDKFRDAETHPYIVIHNTSDGTYRKWRVSETAYNSHKINDRPTTPPKGEQSR